VRKPEPLVLPVRREEERRHLVLHLAVLRVLHDAHDLDVELVGVAPPVAMNLPTASRGPG
jgi:hypothetical protein